MADGLILCNANVRSFERAPEWQAMSIWWQGREMAVACPLQGHVMHWPIIGARKELERPCHNY